MKAMLATTRNRPIILKKWPFLGKKWPFLGKKWPFFGKSGRFRRELTVMAEEENAVFLPNLRRNKPFFVDFTQKQAVFPRKRTDYRHLFFGIMQKKSLKVL
ncbi:MAG: hypothetical protein J5552_07560 [Prevotella sp.]|nr:hypothetical protein [Prevotella sp.]